MKTAVCKGKGCGALIVFALTPAGRLCPFNWPPEEGGKWRIENGRAVITNGIGKEHLFVPHWATCPDDAVFRPERKAFGRRQLDMFGHKS